MDIESDNVPSRQNSHSDNGDYGMSERCPNCPIAEGYCRGFEVRRFCTLLDPTGPKYRPEYKSAVIEQTAQFDPGVKREYPSYAQQAANFAGAMGRAVVAAVTGNQVMCTPEQRAEREVICQGCDKLIDGRCVLCGCPYLKKLALATEDCPLRKWPVIAVSPSPTPSPDPASPPS
jgi:hypothetical protein